MVLRARAAAPDAVGGSCHEAERSRSVPRCGGWFNGDGGYAGAVPKTVPNSEPLSAKTSPTSTKLGRENLNKIPKFPFVFGRR